MASRRIAVIDTSVLILVALPAPKDPPAKRLETITRQRHAEDTLRWLRARRYLLHVPAPVLAELVSPTAEKILEKVFGRTKRPLVRAFDERAAVIASRMFAGSLGRVDKGAPRTCLKFDTMIAAMAHRDDATYLVTANPRDFVRCLSDIGSSVSVLRADEPSAEVAQGSLALADPASEDGEGSETGA